jgi:hypothetical protein
MSVAFPILPPVKIVDDDAARPCRGCPKRPV